MTLQRDDVAPAADHRHSRAVIAAAVVAAVLIAVGITVALTRGSSRPAQHPYTQPTTSTPHVALVATIPPFDSLVLSILNAKGTKWHTTQKVQLSANNCGNYMHNIYISQQCDFEPVRVSATQVLFILTNAEYYHSPAEARVDYAVVPPLTTPTNVTGVGDQAITYTVKREFPAPLAPSQQVTLNGVALSVAYRQTVIDVAFYGANYRAAPDGTPTKVESFSYSEALQEAKSLAQQIVAKLPLKS